ncbi:MAG: cell division protein FtsA [Chthoniobacterales bacterium]
MAKPQIHVGLEIGTSKICAVVAETHPERPLRILGVGETPSRGVRKGEIIDFSTASKCVGEALDDADEKADVKIESVWAAVTGAHIESLNSRGAVTIPKDKEEIDEEDQNAVELSAREVNIPSGNIYLHSLIQHYYIDGQDGILDPIGMLGNRLEAEFHIIHGVDTRIQNTMRCIRESGVAVDDVVVNSLASAQVVIDQQQKDLGVVVLDIGGGVTDFAVYVDGVVRHSGVLTVGGDHITSDLSQCLRIPISKAEKLKIAQGSCSLQNLIPGDTIILKNDAGFSGCEIERSMLNGIINARVDELFSLIRKKIEEVCPLSYLGAGVVITGGSSQLKGLVDLAGEVFEIPVRTSFARNVSGPTSAFENPAYATCIGLIRCAQASSSDQQQGSMLESIKNIFRFKLF